MNNLVWDITYYDIIPYDMLHTVIYITYYEIISYDIHNNII